MIREGQIVLFRFPQTDYTNAKLRPALVIRKLPGPYNDWLISMISTNLLQQIDGLDELIKTDDQDFNDSGHKATSLFRVTRLAVVDKSVLIGIIGEVSTERLSRIKTALSDWIKGS